jgi:hypothetical protein
MNEQEEKTEELINLRNDREEELIKYEWKHNGWVADGLGTVWALMSDMTIDDGISF